MGVMSMAITACPSSDEAGGRCGVRRWTPDHPARRGGVFRFQTAANLGNPCDRASPWPPSGGFGPDQGWSTGPLPPAHVSVGEWDERQAGRCAPRCLALFADGRCLLRLLATCPDRVQRTQPSAVLRVDPVPRQNAKDCM